VRPARDAPRREVNVAHHVMREPYQDLTERLNRCAQGAPPSETLYRILAMLFDEKEARLVALLPIKPSSAAKIARIWGMKEAAARKVLDDLADRGLIVDIEQENGTTYVLPPPMAGFLEFSLMRVRPDLDQKALSELLHQYLNVEEDFVRELFTRGETQLGRTFVHEPALSPENALHVLDYERASEIIKTASHRTVGVCYCRHKTYHLGRSCDAPMEICMTFNSCGASLSRHGIGREVDEAECLDLLDEAWDLGLVQFGENVQQGVNFICNCCGCCCEAMVAARRFAVLHPVHTTNFLPEVDTQTCNGCGTCVSTCPVEAMTLVSANDPAKPKRKQAKLDEDVCLGCGVCVRKCKQHSLTLRSRPQRVITPRDASHRAVEMAIERGVLQHLIFDNRVLFSHRALAAILGVILKLPPCKQLLANRQLRSRYVEWMLALHRG
jgi:ferredoxin